MNFFKEHWLAILAIPLCMIQPELIPIIGAAVVAKFVTKYL